MTLALLLAAWCWVPSANADSYCMYWTYPGTPWADTRRVCTTDTCIDRVLLEQVSNGAGHELIFYNVEARNQWGESMSFGREVERTRVKPPVGEEPE